MELNSLFLNRVGGKCIFMKCCERNSNIELLRIVSMLLILLNHLAVHGIGNLTGSSVSINVFYVKVLGLVGELAVNIFVIISSWFMIEKTININKILKLVGEVFFYSFFIFIILIALNIIELSELSFYKILICIFPVVFGHYWFITCYILLMLLSPYLNEIIEKMDKIRLKKLIQFMIITIVFIEGTIPKSFPNVFSSLIMFILLYFTTGYIKKYVYINRNSIIKNIYIFIGLFIIEISSVIVMCLVGNIINNVSLINYSSYFGKINSFFSFAISLEIFIITIKSKQFKNNIINFLSSSVLSVYLITDHILFKKLLWNRIFSINRLFNNPYFILITILICFVIYVVCIFIDFIRKNTISKVFNYMCRKFFNIKYINNIKKYIIHSKLDFEKML